LGGEAGEGGLLTQQLMRVRTVDRRELVHIRPILRQIAKDLEKDVKPFARRVLKTARGVGENCQDLGTVDL